MVVKVIIIFVGGIILDLLSTRYMRSVAAGQRGTAAALSGVITLANLAIWGSIVQHAETLGIYGAFAMAGGSTVGTLLGFKQRLAVLTEPERTAPPPPGKPERTLKAEPVTRGPERAIVSPGPDHQAALP